MQALPTLSSQNTVVMETPHVPLQRMQTSGRWQRHRGPVAMTSQDTLLPPRDVANNLDPW